MPDLGKSQVLPGNVLPGSLGLDLFNDRDYHPGTAAGGVDVTDGIGA